MSLTRLHLETDGRIIAETAQDVEPILDHNHTLRGQPQSSEIMRHKASVPIVEIHRWLNEEHAKGNHSIKWGSKEFDELIKRKLSDPDNKHMLVQDRTVQGRLGWR